jgi:hypothetical protein
MSKERQLRQIRLEPLIVKELSIHHQSWDIEISELYDEIVHSFINSHKNKEIIYLSQPQDEGVVNVRLLPNVLDQAVKQAELDKRSVPTLIYTAVRWFAGKHGYQVNQQDT